MLNSPSSQNFLLTMRYFATFLKLFLLDKISVQWQLRQCPFINTVNGISHPKRPPLPLSMQKPFKLLEERWCQINDKLNISQGTSLENYLTKYKNTEKKVLKNYHTTFTKNQKITTPFHEVKSNTDVKGLFLF